VHFVRCSNVYIEDVVSFKAKDMIRPTGAKNQSNGTENVFWGFFKSNVAFCVVSAADHVGHTRRTVVAATIR
jgi:hypothetical protein